MPKKFATDEERRAYERERAKRRRAAETPEEHAKRLAQGREWYAANQSKKQQSNRAWKQANIERSRELDRLSYHRHVEQRRESAKKRASQDPERNTKSRNMRAKRSLAIGYHTTEEVDWLYDFQNGSCYYCGVRLVEYHVDHMLPLGRGGTNFAENLCCACPTCNMSKGAKTSLEYREYLNGWA